MFNPNIYIKVVQMQAIASALVILIEDLYQRSPDGSVPYLSYDPTLDLEISLIVDSTTVTQFRPCLLPEYPDLLGSLLCEVAPDWHVEEYFNRHLGYCYEQLIHLGDCCEYGSYYSGRSYSYTKAKGVPQLYEYSQDTGAFITMFEWGDVDQGEYEYLKQRIHLLAVRNFFDSLDT